jgi:hypothetical protein
MNDPKIIDSISKLQRQSRMSLLLVSCGVIFLLGSIYYSVSRLRPLEAQVAARKGELNILADEIAKERLKLTELQSAYDKLKVNTESLYAVKVTPSNYVYEVKASAIATGKQLSQNRPEYRFSAFLNASANTLDQIESVVYTMDHPTFTEKNYVTKDRKSQFARSYVGWGCLDSVEVRIQLKSGQVIKSEFDMCRSLGPEWR